MARPEDVRTVTAVLTAGCNLACTYCYQNSKNPRRRMSWETLREAIDLLLGSRHDDLGLIFYGGEPLLRFDLIQRAVDYVERNRRPDAELEYWVMTNGTLLREREADFLARHNFRAQISSDGVAAAQVLRGERVFETLDGLFDRLREEHGKWFRERLSVSMTLLPSTIGHLAEGVGYLLDKGLRDIGIQPMVTNSAAWRLEQIDELDRQFAEIYELCREILEQEGEIPVSPLRSGEGESSDPEPSRRLCRVDEARSLTFDVDGQVYGCAMFADSYQKLPSEFLRTRLDEMRIGQLRAPEFEQKLAVYPQAVRKAEIFHNKEDNYSSYRSCRDCSHIADCDVCPVSIGNIPGNTDPNRVPDYLCAFNLVTGKYRERLCDAKEPMELSDALRGLADAMDHLQELVERHPDAADQVPALRLLAEQVGAYQDWPHVSEQ